VQICNRATLMLVFKVKIIASVCVLLLINIYLLLLYTGGDCTPVKTNVHRSRQITIPSELDVNEFDAALQVHKDSGIYTDDKWNIFFSGIRRDLQGDTAHEIAIQKFLFSQCPTHELSIRFPLPSIPIVIQTNTGLCLLGAHLTNGTICENSLRGTSSWSPDPHVRDIISSALLTCGLRYKSRDCFAVDVGSNIGAHTMVMLQLGARVVAIEPQMDFCVASRLSAAALGFANRSHIVCGGLAPSAQTVRSAQLVVGENNWRYHGKLSEMPYHLHPVPLVSLERLTSSQRTIDFLKIDTDSIDCSVLQQAIELIDSGVTIKAILLESWDSSCKVGNLIGHQILKLVRMRYTLYRTLVYERSWDDNHHDYENNFLKVGLPKSWTEEFHIGFNFVLWKANGNDFTDPELVAHPNLYPNWQYLFMKDVDLSQSGYKTKDL